MRSSDPRRLALEAQRLEREGRREEAIVAYRELLSRWPDLPELWFNLAVLQRQAGLFDDALESYREALARGVSSPEEAHLNRGVLWADALGRAEAARAEYLRALELNPRYLPAWLNLGNLHEDLGEADAALAAYGQILALEPRHPVALARDAVLRAQRTRDPALTDRLRDALSQPGLTRAARATLGFALAHVLDRFGHYDAAFEAASEAKRQDRQEAAERGLPAYDPVAHARWVDSIVAAFGPGHVRAAQAPGRQAPIFVCGMFRSGSTLVEQILAGHPRVSAGGEIELLPRLVRQALTPFPASMAAATPDALDALADRYLAGLASRRLAGERIVDKRPDNFLYIGLIKALFPDARIVHTTRDALDNLLSIHFLHLDARMSYALDLLDTAHWYRQYRRLMDHWKALYGEDIHDLDYDALVREPREVAGELLRFCGLDWREECLAFGARAGMVKTASVWQVRQPLYRHASGRSRNYAAPLQQVAAALAAPVE